jgi:hypothetical protein
LKYNANFNTCDSVDTREQQHIRKWLTTYSSCYCVSHLTSLLSAFFHRVFHISGYYFSCFLAEHYIVSICCSASVNTQAQTVYMIIFSHFHCLVPLHVMSIATTGFSPHHDFPPLLLRSCF